MKLGRKIQMVYRWPPPRWPPHPVVEKTKISKNRNPTLLNPDLVLVSLKTCLKSLDLGFNLRVFVVVVFFFYCVCVFFLI